MLPSQSKKDKTYSALQAVFCNTEPTWQGRRWRSPVASLRQKENFQVRSVILPTAVEPTMWIDHLWPNLRMQSQGVPVKVARNENRWLQRGLRWQERKDQNECC